MNYVNLLFHHNYSKTIWSLSSIHNTKISIPISLCDSYYLFKMKFQGHHFYVYIAALDNLL